MSSPHYNGSKLLEDQFEKYVQKGRYGEITINPLALDIAWGGDGSRYWSIDPIKKIAVLKEVSWLEVNGSLDMKYLEPGVKYKLEFVVDLNPDASGWKDTPVYLMVKPGGQSKYIWKNADLTRMGDSNVIPSTSPLEFTVPLDCAADDKLNFGLFEIWKGSWKGGLVIQNVIISKVSEVCSILEA